MIVGVPPRSTSYRVSPAAIKVRVPRDATTVQCECGKRLGHVWPLGATTGEVGAVWHVGWKRGGQGHADWLQVTCPKCGRDWRGRHGYLYDLVINRSGGRATLGAAAPKIRLHREADRVQSPALIPSRDW
jgi:hypothetical protein